MQNLGVNSDLCLSLIKMQAFLFELRRGNLCFGFNRVGSLCKRWKFLYAQVISYKTLKNSSERKKKAWI